MKRRLHNMLKVQPGDAIAVFGTGGIGLNALMAASLAGAMPVIGIDPNPTRRAFAKLYGATHVIDPSEADVLAEIQRRLCRRASIWRWNPPVCRT